MRDTIKLMGPRFEQQLFMLSRDNERRIPSPPHAQPSVTIMLFGQTSRAGVCDCAAGVKQRWGVTTLKLKACPSCCAQPDAGSWGSVEKHDKNELRSPVSYTYEA